MIDDHTSVGAILQSDHQSYHCITNAIFCSITFEMIHWTENYREKDLITNF